jgi:hypothetical protein
MMVLESEQLFFLKAVLSDVYGATVLNPNSTFPKSCIRTSDVTLAGSV